MEARNKMDDQVTEPVAEDYTIGWICALQAEYEAAAGMLDEEFEGLETNEPNDDNTYLYGRIGKHNLVIGCLPMGRYGISSAASVARNMVRSFPNLRFALMVGIGGAAPTSERDIRLGDVVVSVPQGRLRGVVQYDSGKRLPDGRFKLSGELDAPPQALLQVLPEVQRRHNDLRKPDRIAEHMRLMSDRVDYQRPLLEDRLYHSEYEHRGGIDCSSCEDIGLKVRSTTRQSSRVVTVHYGVIASSSSVMRDAKQRDEYANDPELNILCFEMEAAGLMNNFPCLVVRGMADYSDSHKNKHWQKYAALAAAAYAKELLHVLKPWKVAGTLPWAEAMEKSLAGLRKEFEQMSIKTEVIYSHQQSQNDKEILDWLTPTDYVPEQRAHFAKRYEGTGTWLFHTDALNEWMSKSGQVLFCPGIPGAGKTIITSLVVNHIQSQYREDPHVGLAFIYCNFKQQEQQHADQLVRSLLKQLSEALTSLPESVKRLYQTHNQHHKTQPSFEELLSVLQTASSQYSRVFIVVDALDELLVSSRERQLFLSAIFKIQETGANIFATSRYNDEIESQFKERLIVHIRASNEDIERYLDGQIRQVTWNRSDIWDDDLRAKVKYGITKAVDGMFLIAQLHASNILAKPTRGDIKEALQLEKGEDGLNQLYKQAMERIESHERTTRDLAKTILMWLVHARRILTATELRHALAIRTTTTTKFEEDYLPSISIIKSVCAGLVTVDEQGGIVRLVHYTTQKYLERTSVQWFGDAHAKLTKSCIIYLSFDTFGQGVCRSFQAFRRRLEEFAFYTYAAQYWGYHSLVAPTMDNEVIQFLQRIPHISASNQAINVHTSYDLVSQKGALMKGLHAAAYFGLARVVTAVVKDTLDLNSRDGTGERPLTWAARRGHEEVVTILLNQDGIEADMRNYHSRTSLSLAAEHGHAAVVALLVKREDVDINSKDRLGQTPLLYAAMEGHEKITDMLINQNNVQAGLKSKRGLTPLLWAARNGHAGVVRLLLKRNDGTLNLEDHEYRRTPLSWAAGNGHKSVVEVLLNYGGVETNSTDIYSDTAQARASKNAHQEIAKLIQNSTRLLRAARNGDFRGVRLLLDQHRVSPNVADLKFRTSLSLAADEGHETVVALLLNQKKVDINSNDQFGWTALSFAACTGHDQVVRLLLEHADVDANSKNNSGETPLSLAAMNGHNKVVKLLISHGKIDIKSKNIHGQTPLSLAALWGREEVVKLLTTHAKVDSKDVTNPMPLINAANTHEEATEALLSQENIDENLQEYLSRVVLRHAAKHGDVYKVKLLLSRHGIDINSRNDDSDTPLLLAAGSGHEEVVQLLLTHKNIDVNVRNTLNETPLSLAARVGCRQAVKLLLSRNDVHANKRNVIGQTPLLLAAQEGHEEIVKLLLGQKGIYPNIRDNHGETPLVAAAKKGNPDYSKVIELLCDQESVNLDARDNDGHSAMWWANSWGHEHIVQVLQASMDRRKQIRHKTTISVPPSRRRRRSGREVSYQN